ncbi:glucan endo-1,3-beta-glucosidase 6-like [Nymphaea colorata]|nr:glucan endo-1,3-beta-glucosidase 6-like [Nymphaea colorata]XP_031476288.1 glucan endo-1,3-beta-glucosidase 6-like [Nymphaea colorata]XP_031476289.1 glucan endo-1,3-beta-glucosidase 6-like [Nymphaea colorata]
MGLPSLILGLVFGSMLVVSVRGIGANWGTQSSHSLAPEIVVRLLRENGFNKAKLFDADSRVLTALGNTGVEVMVGIPNDMLATLASSMKAAENWVTKNVSSLVSRNGVNIKYVAVGNEPFLQTYNGSFLATTFPALQNIQSALIKAGLGNKVKVTVPLNADVYQSSTSYPSGGDFRADIHDLMLTIVKFLSDNGAAFTVNIYPFISLYNDPNFPVDFAFFDGNSSPLIDKDSGKTYTNVFDANHDTLIWALQKNGFGSLPVIVGEVGWPTDGDKNANVQYAQRFNQGFMSHISGGQGTPMRTGPIDAYLFSLIDEDEKSIQPGNFERHWGIFNYDGSAKYALNLGQGTSGQLIPAKGVKYIGKKWCVFSPKANLADTKLADSVSYACSLSDCTSLGYGSTCGNLDSRGNISYAFNMYYQKNNQLPIACSFNDLGMVTTTDPSAGSCRFEVMIDPSLTLTGGCQSKWGREMVVLCVLMLVFLVLTAL